MKNLKLIAIILFSTLLITSCKDDDTSENADIVGIWTVTDLDFDITINNIDLAEFFGSEDQAGIYEALVTATFEEAFEDTTIEFKSDGTYTAKSPGETTEAGTWSLNTANNTMTLDAGTADEGIFNLVTSTSSNLTLQLDETDNSADYDGDNTNDEFRIVVDLNLTK
jgi:hypothetical protein